MKHAFESCVSNARFLKQGPPRDQSARGSSRHRAVRGGFVSDRTDAGSSHGTTQRLRRRPRGGGKLSLEAFELPAEIVVPLPRLLQLRRDRASVRRVEISRLDLPHLGASASTRVSASAPHVRRFWQRVLANVPTPSTGVR
jgi:hypothetical protein